MSSTGASVGVLRSGWLRFAVATAFGLLARSPVWAVVFGPPSAPSGQARFEVVPLGADDSTPKFSTTADGKLLWETNSIGSGGFGGWPTLGAPTIVSDTGPLTTPSYYSVAAGPTPIFGDPINGTGGSMAVSVLSTTPFSGPAGLAWNGTISDASRNGSASISTGLASGSWGNVGDQLEGDPLDVIVGLSTIQVVPTGALMEIGYAGNTSTTLPGGMVTVAGHTFAAVAGIDNTPGGRTSISYGLEDGAPVASFPGMASFFVTPITANAFRIVAAFHLPFGQVIGDGSLLNLRGNLTMAMDPATGSFARPGPLPMGLAPAASGGLSAYAAEPPGSSTEWTNLTGSADFNIGANWSSSSPTSTGEAFLADIGAATPTGKMISAAGPHMLHLITVANAAGNYTLGLAPHQGSFSFGANGGIEVYSGGITTNNCDASSTGFLNYRVGDPTTVLHQMGDVSSPVINVDGLGTLQFLTPAVMFNQLRANGGKTEFVMALTTSATSIQIGGGGTVQLDAGSTLGPGTVTVAAGGTLSLTSGSSMLSSSITNSGTVHIGGGASAIFSGSFSNPGKLTIDAGGAAHVLMPYASSGSITNSGVLDFGNTFTSTQGVGGTGTTNFFQQVSTGAATTAALDFDGNVNFNSGASLLAKLAGTMRGTKYDAILASGAVGLGGSLTLSLIDGFSPSAGESFDLLDGTLSGSFATLSLPVLSAGLMWNASQLSTAGVLSVQITGDYNGNGVVDAADYTRWRDTLGQMGAGLAADGNGNGMIDAADYIFWQMNFGNHAGSGAGATANAAVPEPESLLFLLMGGMVWTLARRRELASDGRVLWLGSHGAGGRSVFVFRW
jgi:hypothetical protein